MGKGDKRSRKGKIFKGSFGNSRPHKAKTSGVVQAVKAAVAAPAPAKAAKAAKPAAKKKAATKKAK